MTEHAMSIRGVDVYVTRFLPEETALGQIAAQRQAVGRLMREIFGRGAGLSHRDDGSPTVDGDEREISISHCSGMAALAVGNHSRIGVDIELPRATLRRVAARFLSLEERVKWKESDRHLLKAWTIKEALYKAAGQRGVDFANDVRLPQNPDADSGTATVVGHDKKEAHYTVYSAPFGEGYLSLAVPQ